MNLSWIQQEMTVDPAFIYQHYAGNQRDQRAVYAYR